MDSDCNMFLTELNADISNIDNITVEQMRIDINRIHKLRSKLNNSEAEIQIQIEKKNAKTNEPKI